MFLETRRIPFLHPKSFRSLSKNDRKMFFFEKLLLKKDLYRRKMQLFQAFRKKTCREADFLSGQSPKKIENLNSLLENIFRRSVPIDT